MAGRTRTEPVPEIFAREPRAIRAPSTYEYYPWAWTCQLDETGFGSTQPGADMSLIAIAAMAEATPNDMLELRSNGRMVAQYSPLHLTHLWPECLLGKPATGAGVVHSSRDGLELRGPPRTIVVTYWLARRGLR